MQHPTTHPTRARTTAALAAAALTLTGVGTAHAAPPKHDNPPAVSVALGTALSTTAQCPGVNVYLNNANPTPTCPVMSAPLTVQNQVPYIVERKPPYGWYPATCLLAGHRWDGLYDQYTAQQAGGVTLGARLVIDDGNCTGPTLATHIDIGVVPRFANYYGVPISDYPQCRAGGANEQGAITIATVSASCAPHTYQGIFGDWERGHYSYNIHIRTGNGQWDIGGSHFIM